MLSPCELTYGSAHSFRIMDQVLLSFAGCVALDKSLTLSEDWAPRLVNRDHNNA